MRNVFTVLTTGSFFVWFASLATGNLYPAVTISFFYAGIISGIIGFLVQAAQAITCRDHQG